MKIAILSFYGNILERGAENWAKQLSTLLAKDCEVNIFSADPGNDYPKPMTKSTSLLRYLFLDYWSRQVMKFTIGTAPKLLNNKYDIVIPINGGWQTFMARLITWIIGAKMVVVGHSGFGWDDKFNAWCFPNVFVGLSEYACKWIMRVNPFIKVHHIRVGVDLNKFSPTGKKVNHLFKNPLVLAVAALEPSKQLDTTIKAVSRLKGVSLLILGSGSCLKSLSELGNSLMPGRFKISKANFDQMPLYYRSSNLFTMASWTRESYPVVYLEAMACGLPVVATDDPARREIVGEAGLFVDPSDIEKYADSLHTALTRNWGNLPRLQAEKFSWDIIAKQYEELFNSL